MGVWGRVPAGGSPRGGAAGRWAETRIAPDGRELTLAQFLRRYGGYGNWNRARGSGRWVETRTAADGSALTRTQFLRRYGNYRSWNRARAHKAVMRLETPPRTGGFCTPPRGRTAFLEGGPRSPDTGGSMTSERCSGRSDRTADRTPRPAHPPSLDRTPLVCQEHARSQAAESLAALKETAAALLGERQLRAECEAALALERAQRRESAAAAEAAEQALLREQAARRELAAALAEERSARGDCAAALAAAECALRAEQSARAELQGVLDREKGERQAAARSAALVERSLLRELAREQDEGRRALRSAAAREGRLRQALLAAEGRAQAAQQRERDERTRASQLLFRAAQRAAERIERERPVDCAEAPLPAAALDPGCSSGGPAAESDRAQAPRDGTRQPPRGPRPGGHVLTPQERAEIRRTEGRLLTSEIVVDRVALYAPGRWLLVSRATARSIVPVLNTWAAGFDAGAEHVYWQFLNYGRRHPPAYPDIGFVHTAIAEVYALTAATGGLLFGPDQFAVELFRRRCDQLINLYQHFKLEWMDIQEFMCLHAAQCRRALTAIGGALGDT